MTTQHTIAQKAPSATALTAAQVEAVIRGWITKGLPDGRISWPELRGRFVRLHMSSPTDVVVWAAALDADVQANHFRVCTSPAWPVDLQGWDIQVWCTAPLIPDALRIKTLGGDR